MNSIDIAKHVLDTEISALAALKSRLDTSFDQAVQLLCDALKAGGRIIVTGVGKSYHIGQKMAATLTSTGASSSVLHPSEAMHGDLGLLKENDILLMLSYSGESDEMVNLLPLVHRMGVRVIAMTGNKASTLATHSTLTLDVSVEKEACPFNLIPTASTTATLAMGDALAIALLEARGFRKEDFARLHPGGAIGRALLLKVDDIMRTGDRLAIVKPTATVHEAILAMTGARAGAVAVCDEARTLLGILTDGDLRRHLADAHADILSADVSTIMTVRPISVQSGQLAVDALSIFQQHSIDDIVVLNAQQQLAGIIDIQDLPKFKIF